MLKQTDNDVASMRPNTNGSKDGLGAKPVYTRVKQQRTFMLTAFALVDATLKVGQSHENLIEAGGLS